jgi:VanZ family protein
LQLFIRNFRYWIVVALWLAVIAAESLFLSSRVTGGWLWDLVKYLHIPMSADEFGYLHHLLRKAGHVTGYGILCVLLFRAWWHTLAGVVRGNLRVRCTVLSLLVTLIAGALDEWHQSFDPLRTSSVRDVALDVTGGIVFLTIALFVFKLWRVKSLDQLETVSA